MTTKQIQCLLTYLGYEVTADGAYGPQTRAAVREFQNHYGGIAVDGDAGAQTQKALRDAVAYNKFKPPDTENQSGSFWDEIEHFTRAEFECKCGQYCDGFPAEPEEQLIRLAEQVRTHFGKPVTVSSGVRCTRHNANVGGVANSRHLSGKAMDFTVRGISSEAVLAYVKSLPGVRYASAINGNYVHVDVN